MSSASIFILALDPSTGSETSAVGAVVVEFPADPNCVWQPIIRDACAFDGESSALIRETEKRLWQRLRSLRYAVGKWARGLDVAFDILAVEQHTGRGYWVSKSLNLANGALLTHPVFDGFLPVWIAPNTAKATAGASRSKGAASKLAVQDWASAAFSPNPLDGLPPAHMEAIADALAVACSAYSRYQCEERKQTAKDAQTTMRLRAKPKPKEVSL